MPLELSDRGGGDWTGGVGDIAFAFKRAVAHSAISGRIFSAATERGIGGGTAVFEPFVTFGQILRAGSFLPVHAGLEIPFNRDHSDEVF